jgi:hypothetical protein
MKQTNAIFTYRQLDCATCTQPALYTIAQRSVRYLTAHIFRPFFECFCFAERGSVQRVAAIARLLLFCRKATITWSIVPVVVAPLNLQSRPVAVRKSPRFEDTKTLPSVTDLYATCAVAFVGFTVRIVTTLAHRCPCTPYGTIHYTRSIGQFSHFSPHSATAVFGEGPMRSFGRSARVISPRLSPFEILAQGAL